MTVIRETTLFDAPIDRVFELITDYKRYPEWNVNYLDVTEVVGPQREKGTKIHTVMKFLGRRLDGWAEVVEVDAPSILRLSGASEQGGHLNVAYRLASIEGRTEVRMDLDYELPAGPFGKVLDRLFIERAVERDLRHSIENFKALVEAPVPVLA